MGIELLTERLKDQIAGLLSCWDRVLIFGTLPGICYAEGMTRHLYGKQVRIFDYPKFAEPYRDCIRENAEGLAKAAGLEIEFIRKRNIRKEDLVKAALLRRANNRGWCAFFRRWNRVRRTSRGTTKPPARPSCGRTMANVCTTTFVSSTTNWGCAAHSDEVDHSFRRDGDHRRSVATQAFSLWKQ
jgi:hypothetical protein